jgi:hypothetical protein
MATKKNTPPSIKSATKPFMAAGFNPPKKGKTNDVSSAPVNRTNDGTVNKRLYKMGGSVKKSNVSSGKGFDLVKDKMRARVSKVKKQIRSSTVSRGSGKAGGGNNLCKSPSKF